MITYTVQNISPAWGHDAYLALVDKVQPASTWKNTIPLTSAVIAVGGCGGIALFFEVTGAQDGNGWYSPYYSQGENADDERSIEENPSKWLRGMMGAANWEDWEWDGPYADIPYIY